MELKDTAATGKKSFYKKNKKKVRRAVLLILAIALASGIFIANKKIKAKGYNGLWDFTKTITSNYWKGLDAKPENLSIKIKDKDFKFLENNREKALERGIIINDIDGDYVPAELEYNGKKISVKLRLKGHMTDHLQDNKWSFRIKVKDNSSFMGMKRFSIQHPGTRGYVYEWIYHELMKQEGVIALRYKFINVTVNGRDWGIYAVEENFEDELIENNGRKRGPILRFNPDLYWTHRYNMMERVSSVDEYSSYYSANPEAYREEKVLKDSSQRMYYLKAIALVEGLRSKKLSVDQVFDVKILAKFHAVIDLVGGQNSIDWSDVKYYYNPITGLLEPVAYESFTDFPVHEIAGAYKYYDLDSTENYKDWYDALFSNPVFYREYVKNLERLSEPSYMDKFFGDANKELQNNLAILYKEFPYKKFEKQGYYKNQKVIKRILSAPKAFHAYFSSASNGQLYIQLGAIESLPVEITSLVIGNVVFPVTPVILPAKQPDQYVNYKEYRFSVPTGTVLDDSLVSLLKINYSVLGSAVTQVTNVFPFPHTDSEFIEEDLKNKQGNVKDFSFLTVDELSKTIYFKEGKQVIDKDLIIPAGYNVVANGKTSIDIIKNAKIVSYSSFTLNGNEDEPIIIESTDSTSDGIEVINAGKSLFHYVVFKNLPAVHDQQWKRKGALTFYESPVGFLNCSFYNSKAEDALSLIRSTFSLKECLFHKMKDDALDADFSDGTIANCVFEDCSENAIDVTMGKINAGAIYINGAGNKALNAKAGAQIKGRNIRIKNANIGISGEDLSMLDLQDVDISDTEIGLVAYKNKPGGGHPSITVSGLKLTRVKKNYLKEKKSTMIVNKAAIEEDTDDVEAIIKSDKKKHK